MNLIKNDLRKLGIVHDNFVSENYIVNQNLVEKALNILKEKNYVYEGVLEKPKGNEIDDWEPRKQILFQSTKFGDDTDRALKKSDGTWTYFANDVAYHLNKIERKFDLLINVLGADHAGYLKRQSSCVSALSENKQQIISKVCQLVKLFKSGNQLKMSKRAGDFITASDLISEVGKDSVRFMMIYRSNDSQLDFDFDLVTDHSKENPVFYVGTKTTKKFCSATCTKRKPKFENCEFFESIEDALAFSSLPLSTCLKASVACSYFLSRSSVCAVASDAFCEYLDFGNCVASCL